MKAIRGRIRGSRTIRADELSPKDYIVFGGEMYCVEKIEPDFDDMGNEVLLISGSGRSIELFRHAGVMVIH